MKRLIPFAVIAILSISAIGMWFAFSSYNLEPTIFIGTTSMGTTIGLELQVKNGEIKGEGFHVFSSGQVNNIVLLGKVERNGDLFIIEKYTKDNTRSVKKNGSQLL